MAGSSVTWSFVAAKLQNKERSKKYVITWTADDADGSVPSTQSNSDIFGFIVRVVTNPGATTPTADYDITITDEDGVDVLGGEGADRSASASEQIIPKLGSSYGPCYVNSKLTFNLSNNSENSAVGEVIIYVEA